MATVTNPGRLKAAKATKAPSKVLVGQRLKQAQKVATLFKQVSDATRLQVIIMLSEGERHVGALGEPFNMSQAALSHHLALLRHGGIIEPRRDGKRNFYALTEKGEQLARIVLGVVD